MTPAVLSKFIRYTMGARTGVRIQPMIVNQNPGPGQYFSGKKAVPEQQKAPFGNSALRLPPVGLNNVPGEEWGSQQH